MGVLVVATEETLSYRRCCKNSVCDLFSGGGLGLWHLLGRDKAVVVVGD